MVTLILNKNNDQIPDDSVYIGRGSKWGNKFKIGIDGSRSEVIDKYEEWLKVQDDLLNSLSELEGKPLVCFCKPRACHGDILIKVLNMTPEQRKSWQTNKTLWSDFYESN